MWRTQKTHLDVCEIGPCTGTVVELPHQDAKGVCVSRLRHINRGQDSALTATAISLPHHVSNHLHGPTGKNKSTIAQLYMELVKDGYGLGGGGRGPW